MATTKKKPKAKRKVSARPAKKTPAKKKPAAKKTAKRAAAKKPAARKPAAKKATKRAAAKKPVAKKLTKKAAAKKPVAKKPVAKKPVAKKPVAKKAAAKKPAAAKRVAKAPAKKKAAATAPAVPPIVAQRKAALAGRSVADLKAMLRKNDQLTGGSRGELVERILDRVEHGNLPRCPQCYIGRLRVRADGSFSCPGGYDDDEYKECNYVAAKGTVERPPWEFETAGVV